MNNRETSGQRHKRKGKKEVERNKQRGGLVQEARQIWNQAPRDIKEAKNMETAKRLIKQHYKTLPI